MEIICFDGKFASDKLEYYKEHGVTVPIQDSIYTVRAVITNSNGKKGFLLNEIINPSIPIIGHPILGNTNMEPNFSVFRFQNLDGSELNLREISNYLKIKQKEILLSPI